MLEDILFFNWVIGKHTSLEVQLSYCFNSARIGAEAWWDRKCDHAGFGFSISLLFVYFHVMTYDHRHVEDMPS